MSELFGGGTTGGIDAPPTYAAFVITADAAPRAVAALTAGRRGVQHSAAQQAAAAMLDDYGFDVETVSCDPGEALGIAVAEAAGLRDVGPGSERGPDSDQSSGGDEGSVNDQSSVSDQEPADLIIVIGGLGVGLSADAASSVRGALDAELPGIKQTIRRAQLDAGYSRAVFEEPACGWAAETLVICLPDDVTAVQASIQEIGAIVLDVLDELTDARPDVDGSAGESPLPAVRSLSDAGPHMRGSFGTPDRSGDDADGAGDDADGAGDDADHTGDGADRTGHGRDRSDGSEADPAAEDDEMDPGDPADPRSSVVDLSRAFAERDPQRS